MTVSGKKIFCMVIEYLNDSNHANLLLSEELATDPHLFKLNNKTKLTGNPNNEIITYSFHGVGCYIKTKYYEVDFDYNSNGKIKTFNSYMVYHHAKTKGRDITENDFNNAYSELIKNGIIIKSNDTTGREEELSEAFEWN